MYENQYILIGGAACDILFANMDANFEATRDLDMVLLVEALTPEFGNRFWDYIKEGGYRNKASSNGNPQFYRFDKPEREEFPKMVELFSRTVFPLHEMTWITPVHLDDTVSSLSAILLNDEYCEALVCGRTVIDGLSVLKPEYLILFKAKAYLDLKNRKANEEKVDSSDIKKHKKGVSIRKKILQ